MQVRRFKMNGKLGSMKIRTLDTETGCRCHLREECISATPRHGLDCRGAQHFLRDGVGKRSSLTILIANLCQRTVIFDAWWIQFGEKYSRE